MFSPGRPFERESLTLNAYFPDSVKKCQDLLDCIGVNIFPGLSALTFLTGQTIGFQTVLGSA